MHIHLSPEAFAKAKHYLFSHGRPLEQARFRRLFEGGSSEEVLSALATYQNEDGGFGQALEPDVRSPSSSVMATLQALHLHYSLAVPSDEPQLAAATAWLRRQLHNSPQGAAWPFLPPQAQQSAHAPWWDQSSKDELSERFGHFLINPRAEIVALLWQWPSLLPEGLLPQLTAESRDAILRGIAPDDHYSQRAAAVFAGLPAVPSEYRQPVIEYLRDLILAQPDLNALWLAPVPEHPLTAHLRPQLHAALDELIAAQGPDGAWVAPWHWQTEQPEAQQAQQDWKSIQTMNALSTLWAWDRLEKPQQHTP